MYTPQLLEDFSCAQDLEGIVSLKLCRTSGFIYLDIIVTLEITTGNYHRDFTYSSGFYLFTPGMSFSIILVFVDDLYTGEVISY